MNYRIKQGIAALLIALVIFILGQSADSDITGAAGFVAIIGVILIVWGLLTPSRAQE